MKTNLDGYPCNAFSYFGLVPQDELTISPGMQPILRQLNWSYAVVSCGWEPSTLDLTCRLDDFIDTVFNQLLELMPKLICSACWIWRKDYVNNIVFGIWAFQVVHECDNPTETFWKLGSNISVEAFLSCSLSRWIHLSSLLQSQCTWSNIECSVLEAIICFVLKC